MKLWNKFLVMAIALAVVAAACGGDDNETVSITTPPAEAPAPVPAQDPAAPGTIVDVATEAGSFGTLLAAVDAAGLTDTLLGEGPFTVFAPTDEAFAALPEGTVEALLADIPALTDILLYHVVPGVVLAADVATLTSATSVQGSDIGISFEGNELLLNQDSRLLATNITASNGVIHVIDKVILPPAPEAMAPGTIVDVATEAGSFGTLLAAVEAAGLVDTLAGEGPFTVFAPTDEAFAALPEGTVEALLADIPALTDILLYHVVAGEVLAADVVGLDSATTVQGSDVAITVDGGNVFLNGTAQVIATDIAASNGVIHVIDKVILPPSN